MSRPWLVRVATPKDADLLAFFTCVGAGAAEGEVWEREVEDFIRVMAVVHQDNARSLALCHRYGLTQELTRPDPAYRRLITGVITGPTDG